MYKWQSSLSCLPIIYNPPETVSIHGHLDGTWHSATSSQRHSWLYTNEQGENTGRWQKLIFWINNFVGIWVACLKAYSTFIQLCSDGFHQPGHGGGRACDIGGACVNHSCAAFCTEHHLHPHWNTGGIEAAVNMSSRMCTNTLTINIHMLFNIWNTVLTLSWLLPICLSLWCPYN